MLMSQRLGCKRKKVTRTNPSFLTESSKRKNFQEFSFRHIWVGKPVRPSERDIEWALRSGAVGGSPGFRYTRGAINMV